MSEKVLNLLMASSTKISKSIRLALEPHFNDFHLHRVDTKQALTQALGEKQWNLIFSEMNLSDFSADELPKIFEHHGLSIPVALIADSSTASEVLQQIEFGVCALVQCEEQYLHYIPVTVNALLKQAKAELQQSQIKQQYIDSEERFNDIFNNTSDMIQCLAPDGSFIYTNKSWRKAMGYSETEVEELNLMDVLHPESLLCCQDRFERLKIGQELKAIDFKFLTKQGETLDLIGDCGSIMKDGNAISTRGIFQNVTKKMLSDKALKESEARYQTLYELAPDIYTCISDKGEILSMNQTGLNLLGYTKDELVGSNAISLVFPDDQHRVRAHIEKIFTTGNDDAIIEYRKITKNNAVLWVQERAKLDEEAGVPRLLVACRDITVQHELQEKLKFHATHDSLTQLINRHEFERRLTRVLSDMRTNDEHALCFLDLDKFKIINDSSGHAAGDELLRKVTKILYENIRARDTLARIGGDEFVILMEHCPLDAAVRLAEKIRNLVADFEFKWRAQTFSIGISVGIVRLQKNSGVAEMLGKADKACYKAKDMGRNTIYVNRENK